MFFIWSGLGLHALYVSMKLLPRLLSSKSGSLNRFLVVTIDLILEGGVVVIHVLSLESPLYCHPPQSWKIDTS